MASGQESSRPSKGRRPWARTSDDELIALASSGDHEAQHQLLTRFQRLISLVASSVTGPALSFDEARQVAQVALWEAALTYDSGRGGTTGATFPTYASRCMQNALYSSLRSANAQKNEPFSQSATHGRDGATGDTELAGSLGGIENVMGLARGFQCPQEEADFESSIREMARALFEVLTNRERQVLLGFLAGETYQQISDRLGVSYKAVDGAIQRIRKKAQNSHL